MGEIEFLVNCYILFFKNIEILFLVISYYKFIFVKNLGNNLINMYYCYRLFICFFLDFNFYDYRKLWGFCM